MPNKLKKHVNIKSSVSSSSPIDIDTVILDIEKMNVNETGVLKFWWPFHQDEFIKFRDELCLSLIKEIKSMSRSNHEDTVIIHVLLLHLIRETIATYVANTVVQRYKNNNIKLILYKDSEVFDAVYNNRDLTQSSVTEMLKNGFPRNIWKTPLRRIRNKFISDGLHRVEISNVDRTRDIVTVVTAPLIFKHANSIDERVILNPLRNWFYPLSTKEFRESKPVCSSVIDNLLSVIENKFSDQGLTVQKNFSVFTRSWLHDSSRYARAYYDRLMRNDKTLPKQLWTGTGGNTWIRIIRQAVRSNNGIITGHDHSSGDGHWQSNLRNIVEFDCCDRFITFTNKQVEELENKFCHNLCLQEATPVIETINYKNKINSSKTINAKKITYNRNKLISCEKIKIMYVPSFYPGEKIWIESHRPDIVAIDWQARLFYFLKECGFMLIHKPHPGSHTPPPQIFEDIFQVKTIHDKFEKVINYGDVILFDSARTTTFSTALKNNKPVVLIDFGIHELTRNAKKLLKKRCVIIDGIYDSNGKAQIDWEQLKIGITKSLDLTTNNEFTNAYFGVG